MANITYDDFVKACNKNDFEKFNGKIQFEITFKQWAKMEKKYEKAFINQVLSGAKILI